MTKSSTADGKVEPVELVSIEIWNVLQCYRTRVDTFSSTGCDPMSCEWPIAVRT
jgi:hypothetical protein